MVEHIIAESAHIFKRTTNSHDWKFYYDALALLIAKDTTVWMKEEGHYKRWILPESELLKVQINLK
jgi:hypothetical protein